jgi:hypothetical protein
MNRWSSGFLRVVFALVIALLGLAVSVGVRTALSAQNNGVAGIAFLITVICLVLFFEKVFPSVYASSSRRRPPKLWQSRAVWVVIFGVMISIFSSRVASLWFGLTLVGSVLVALLLRAKRSSGEL